MAKNDLKSGAGLFLLKECYELAARVEKQDAAKRILQNRARGIDISAQQDQSICAPKTPMQIVSEVMSELSLEGRSNAGYASVGSANKVEHLPDCGEKEFMLALLSLGTGTGEAQRLGALRYIRSALRYTPDDPRYIALATILQEQDIE